MKHNPTEGLVGESRPRVVQARAKETRLRILTQAEIAFAENGFDGTSLTAHILDPAGVSVGSFYHQFENKREVLFALLEWRLDERRNRTNKALGASAQTWGSMLTAAALAFMDDIDRHPNIWAIQFRELQSPDLEIRRAMIGDRRKWENTADEVLERLIGVASPNTRSVAHVVSLCLNNVLRDYSSASAQERVDFRERVLQPAVELCVGGTERILGIQLC